MNKDISYGPVLITKGSFKGRIMYYDDDNYEGRTSKAICYLGGAWDLPPCYDLPPSYLSLPTQKQAKDRLKAIRRILTGLRDDSEYTGIDVHALWSEAAMIESHILDNTKQ